jgi:internalin A
LRELNNLTSLNLRSNQISDFSFLRELNNLTSLDLSNNQISDCSFLRELNNLISLNLSNSQISDCSFLRELNNLISLNLSNSQISDFSFLRKVRNLTSLDLSDNQISDFSFLKELNNLTSLNLWGNQINNCSFLRELNNLTSLNLWGNQIRDCSFLRELTNLTSLDLSGNQIRDCSFLRELTNLTSLDLGSNQIRDFSFLRELNNLTSLGLSQNQIRDCSFLRELNNLTSLDLRDNQIRDCSFLRELNNLTSLGLSQNQISDCSFLRELANLTSLDLSDNQIRDCSFLRELTNLTYLDLSSNQISEIPPWLAAWNLKIKIDKIWTPNGINLYKNPITEPPLDIVHQGNAAILNYYQQLATQGKDYLYEAKMLIVGEGEAGKTTLAHKIADPRCPLPHIDDRTRGISIQTHCFDCRSQDSAAEIRPFHLNIWDFGGQEIHHYTHRFFLSKRSLYVLVADNRKDDTDFNYWLNIIEQFAGNSPLLIVLNEKNDVQRTLNSSELRGRYPDSVKEILALNFKTQEETDVTKAQVRLTAIQTLIRHIEHYAQNLPHIGEAVPARWVDVRQAIEQDDRNHIDREKFDQFCEAHGITQTEDIDTLLGHFHEIGIVLYFADNPLLRHRVILKPTWATNAVYRIFEDDQIKAHWGRFNRQDCAKIWCDSTYRYAQDTLIELMKSFRLVYEIDTTGNLVAPQLLSPNTPNYPWDDRNNSYMQFNYDAFMPKGIFWQLAVTLYRYIPDHNWIWRNGMVICRGNTWAEITEDMNLRHIALRFVGPSIAELRAIIVDTLDHISNSYHKLAYDKMIPCRCSQCQASADPFLKPHLFKYATLKKRQESGRKPTIECERSEEDVSLNLLLEGFDVQHILKALPDKQGHELIPPTWSPPLSIPKSPEPPEPTMQTIKIFLASSSELKSDREQFEIFINRKNKDYIKNGIFLELVLWEDFLDAMSQTRLQDEYNKAITGCDVFVSLFYSKVGQYTREEFLNALETFKANGKPLIYTYFKKLVTEVTRANRKDFDSLFDFQEELSDKGHFYTTYDTIEDLKYKFGEQLVKFLPQLQNPTT